MCRCEVWGLVQCPRPAVERLAFFNALNVNGCLWVCAEHLARELDKHLLS